jgi:hypothetical protein
LRTSLRLSGPQQERKRAAPVCVTGWKPRESLSAPVAETMPMATAVSKITLSSWRDIPFNKLVLSQSNVRRVKAGVSIEDLAADIARRGCLLQGGSTHSCSPEVLSMRKACSSTAACAATSSRVPPSAAIARTARLLLPDPERGRIDAGLLRAAAIGRIGEREAA